SAAKASRHAYRTRPRSTLPVWGTCGGGCRLLTIPSCHGATGVGGGFAARLLRRGYRRTTASGRGARVGRGAGRRLGRSDAVVRAGPEGRAVARRGARGGRRVSGRPAGRGRVLRLRQPRRGAGG